MALTKRYYSVNGEMLYEKATSRVDYLPDALGSITATSAPGSPSTVENTYRMKPYGSTLVKTGAGVDPRFRWLGTVGYRRTNLFRPGIYVRVRHYGQEDGKWTTVDPFWPLEPAFSYTTSPCMEYDYFGTCVEGAKGWHYDQCPYNAQNPGPIYRRHDCQADPCGYVYNTGQVEPGVTGYVACCMGVAYPCLIPGFPNKDKDAIKCAKWHEKSHLSRSDFCKGMSNSGCRALGIYSRDYGGGWFDVSTDADECIAYSAELECLLKANKRRHCGTYADWAKHKPLDKKKYDRCGELWSAITDVCENMKEVCKRFPSLGTNIGECTDF